MILIILINIKPQNVTLFSTTQLRDQLLAGLRERGVSTSKTCCWSSSTCWWSSSRCCCWRCFQRKLIEMMNLTKELLLWQRGAGARGWLWGGRHQAETCSRLPGSPSTHQTDDWGRSHHKIIIRVISETGKLQSGHANIFLEKLEDSLKAV